MLSPERFDDLILTANGYDMELELETFGDAMTEVLEHYEEIVKLLARVVDGDSSAHIEALTDLEKWRDDGRLD
jgi:hypothetical protein